LVKNGRFLEPVSWNYWRPTKSVPFTREWGTSGRLYLCTINNQAAHFARKPARAFFPSLVASAMVSKKTADRFTGPDRPTR
jgi:hypothetical protein